MKVKKEASTEVMECVQGILDGNISIAEISHQLRRMADSYLVNSPDTPEARQGVFKSFSILDEFLMFLGDAETPDYIEGLYYLNPDGTLRIYREVNNVGNEESPL